MRLLNPTACLILLASIFGCSEPETTAEFDLQTSNGKTLDDASDESASATNDVPFQQRNEKAFRDLKKRSQTLRQQLESLAADLPAEQAMEIEKLVRARFDLERFQTASSQYRRHTGRFAKSLQELQVPPDAVKDRPQATLPTNASLTDPWDNPYQMEKVGPSTVKFSSAGRDGKAGTDDDIVIIVLHSESNWRKINDAPETKDGIQTQLRDLHRKSHLLRREMEKLAVKLGPETAKRIEREVRRESKIHIAEMKLANCRWAALAYALFMGKLPQTFEDLRVMPDGFDLQLPNNQLPIQGDLIDPWDNPYRMEVVSPQSIKFSSDGPDGKPNTEDDVIVMFDRQQRLELFP